jgi:hypothetical protein
MQFASDFTYDIGMPGPSLTWSFLSNSFQESAKHMRSGAVVPLLLERLDESLIALRHEMGWSLADIVVMKPRKALSKHPRASDWPPEAVKVLNASLHRMREFDFYETARSALQKRVDHLSVSGVDFSLELEVLRALRSRVAEVRCSLVLHAPELIYSYDAIDCACLSIRSACQRNTLPCTKNMSGVISRSRS